jgi:hypothetical protein
MCVCPVDVRLLESTTRRQISYALSKRHGGVFWPACHVLGGPMRKEGPTGLFAYHLYMVHTYEYYERYALAILSQVQ